MTTKYIFGYFFLIYISNYLNFLGFYKILQNLPGEPGKKLYAKTRWYFIMMNCLYGATIALAFIPRFGPWCTADKVYPACMNWIATLFIINFIFHWVINCNKDYYLSEGPVTESASTETLMEQEVE